MDEVSISELEDLNGQRTKVVSENGDSVRQCIRCGNDVIVPDGGRICGICSVCGYHEECDDM